MYGCCLGHIAVADDHQLSAARIISAFRTAIIRQVKPASVFSSRKQNQVEEQPGIFYRFFKRSHINSHTALAELVHRQEPRRPVRVPCFSIREKGIPFR